MDIPPDGDLTQGRASYERAAAGWDDTHEHELAAAIFRAMADASIVSDVNCCVMRTGETASALLTVLATVLAMSPAAVRSPTALRKTVDELGKRLRRRVALAENNADLQAFIRRAFHSGDVGGHA